MKKSTLIYAFLLVLTTIVVSCKKDTEVNKDTFKIENEKVEASTQSVKITGTYAYLGAIDGITLELGRQADLMDGDAYRTLLEGTDFSVEVKNLRTNTTYYYRYSVDYGGKAPYSTEIKTFKTEEYNLPEVKSKEVVSVGVNRAEVSGEVLSDGGGDAVTLRGICWSMSHNPSVGDEYANAGEGIGTFTCELTNLQPEKTYYARAFAGNSKGVSYGEELTLLTMAAGSLAEVKTIGITGNANLQATVSGEVTNEGASSVIERGVCYGKEHYPTTSGLHVSAGSGTGEFSCQLTNLEAGATYYVRAYAINGQGISYGDEMSFEAQTEVTVPVVFTGMVSDITVSSATGHGTVVSDGGATVTRRGLCWSMEHEPTTGDIYADCGNGVGEFSGLMPHLENMTTYYVRAYAENAVGMAYGEEVSFTVGQHEHVDLPFVETMQIMDVTSTTAWGTGEVLNDGGGTITDRGLCWSTSQEPTIGDSHASGGTGMGFFEVQMTDLEPSTTYYVRAYARNSAGVAYGNEMEFTTMSEAGLPTVMTLDVIDITATTAICGGEVMDDGGDEVYEKGVCWSTSQGPTINDNHASGGTGIGFFEVQMTDLEPSTTYYVRAYARNNVGVAYGDEMEFTTMSEAGLPTVMTVEVFNITATSAICAGEVMDDGGAEVFEKGVCWSTSHNPTLNDNHVIGGEGGGFFEVEMNDLTPGTTYYVRAYAINSVGTGYGEEVSFTTEAEALGDTFFENFEAGMPAGWTTIDSDGDGYSWMLGSSQMGTGYGHYGSADCVYSESYDNSIGVLYPDNYLVSPQVTLGTTSIFSFYACAQDANYAAEHFGVAISTTGTTPSNFTVVQEWTMTAKSGGNLMSIGRDGANRAQGNWYQYTVDLSAYAGQKVYIAIRHFNCSDMFYLDVDDIELSNAKK